MSEIVHISYYLNCCILDKVLCLRSELLSFERCRDFGCRFLPDRVLSFQEATTDRIHFLFKLQGYSALFPSNPARLLAVLLNASGLGSPRYLIMQEYIASVFSAKHSPTLNYKLIRYRQRAVKRQVCI